MSLAWSSTREASFIIYYVGEEEDVDNPTFLIM